mmetsp:Transcript_23249/g.64841  ORF Transcript_23249/g.64841 Transcript_23249/m.64841 type:complete len:319 (-) Transcript_23249:443-1399(-)|eukprot:CAMPEP_0198125204 /NCGR_PEP_ID=MMETSP1442-20131203/42003_1 /TAXON_ID= /ORGANISM="Craspedostauros australis, Strain CCMP3328" /LENGTH=318 /DNA_ID=CAMNT_0043784761 /DNA_START=436 /DNA_END=1392 /DNA_ORIENTATION=-
MDGSNHNNSMNNMNNTITYVDGIIKRNQDEIVLVAPQKDAVEAIPFHHSLPSQFMPAIGANVSFRSSPLIGLTDAASEGWDSDDGDWSDSEDDLSIGGLNAIEDSTHAYDTRQDESGHLGFVRRRLDDDFDRHAVPGHSHHSRGQPQSWPAPHQRPLQQREAVESEEQQPDLASSSDSSSSEKPRFRGFHDTQAVTTRKQPRAAVAKTPTKKVSLLSEFSLLQFVCNATSWGTCGTYPMHSGSQDGLQTFSGSFDDTNSLHYRSDSDEAIAQKVSFAGTAQTAVSSTVSSTAGMPTQRKELHWSDRIVYSTDIQATKP